MKKSIFLFALLVAMQTYAQNVSTAINTNYTFNKNLVVVNDTLGLGNNNTSLSSVNSSNIYFKNKNTAKMIESGNSPYEWKWVRDGIWTGVGLGASAVGLILIQNKEELPENEKLGFTVPVLLQKKIDNINFLDKWVAGNHSEGADSFSNIPFGVSFVAPLALLFDDDINDHTGQFLGLYLESLATTAGLYTITAGLVDRSRPYVYDNSGDTSDSRRFGNNGQRAFYSGHVAATATATFFAAKVYSDYHPDANGKVFVWAGAAALPAAVGVFRLEAGQHFLTDVLLGYALGAATGILVPELHKKKNENLDLYPSSGTAFNGDRYKGMALSYSF